MDAVAFEDERVIEASKQFVPVMLNCTAPGLTDKESFATSEEAKARMKRYAVTGWPTLLVTSPDGDVLHRSHFAGSDLMLERLTTSTRRWKQLSRTLTWVDARTHELKAEDAGTRERARLELEHLLRRVRDALPADPAPKEPAKPKAD